MNFAPRVTMPVLMLNGRFDYFFPTATSQEPMFALLGTPPEHKRRVVYETSHAIPRTEIEHAIESFARTSGATIHLSGSGRNDHHLAEAAFKALGRALRVACELDPRRARVSPRRRARWDEPFPAAGRGHRLRRRQPRLASNRR